MKYTNKQLYEQTKRVLRQLVVQNKIAEEGDAAFILACQDCGLPFRKDIEIGMLAEHVRFAHGRDPEIEGNVRLDLIWIGEGPPPEIKKWFRLGAYGATSE